MVKRESPRIRRLRTDFKALTTLKSESSILDFELSGSPAEVYQIRFYGRGFWRPEGSPPQIRELHEVSIRLGASYPRMMPELMWRSPIFHPNISASGVVCLGGYGTNWVPSLNLDELCIMLWDMIRYGNYDVESPYNREAAIWAKTQNDYQFPVDARPMRDLVAGAASSRPSEPPITATPPASPDQLSPFQTPQRDASPGDPSQGEAEPDVLFLEGASVECVDDLEEIVDAELVDAGDSGIMFIE